MPRDPNNPPQQPTDAPAAPEPLGGLILAAGASSRMGQAKALLPWRDATCGVVLARSMQRAGLLVVAVVPPNEDGKRIAQQLAPFALVVENPDPSRGPTSSLHCGAAALLARGCSSAIISPVDQPELHPDTAARLVAALREGFPAVVMHQAQAGHPYALPDLSRLLALSLDETPRSLLEGARVVEAGPEVLLNLNTPADYRAAFRLYLEEGSDG